MTDKTPDKTIDEVARDEAHNAYLAAREKMAEAKALYQGASTALGNAATAYYRAAGIPEFQAPPGRRASGNGRKAAPPAPPTLSYRMTRQVLPGTMLVCMVVGAVVLVGALLVGLYRLVF